MKTSSNRLENLHAEMTVTIPADELENRFKKNMEEATTGVVVSGFRKGKAPKSIVEKQINKDKVWEITREELIEETITTAARQENLSVMATMAVNQDEHKVGEDFTYHAKLRLMPEIPDVDYKNIPIRIPKLEVTEEQIEQGVKNLLISWAETTPIADRPAQDGDWALLQVEGHQISRIAIPGQSDTPKNMFPPSQLTLQINGERGIPWLDSEVIGMRTNETKTAHVMMPKDFINPPLEEDTEIEVKILVQWLEEKTIPELTEEYLVEKNIAKDMDEFKGKIRETLEQQAKHYEDEAAVAIIHDWLVENMSFELPEDILEEKKEEIIERVRQDFHQHGEDLDVILKHIDDKSNEIRAKIDRQSRELLTLDFLITQIAEKEDLTVEQNELLNHIQTVAQQANLNKAQIQKLTEDSDFLSHSFSNILSRKVTNFLLNHAKREYIDKDELLAEAAEKSDSDGKSDSNYMSDDDKDIV